MCLSTPEPVSSYLSIYLSIFLSVYKYKICPCQFFHNYSPPSLSLSLFLSLSVKSIWPPCQKYLATLSKVFGHPQKLSFLILKLSFLMNQVKHSNVSIYYTK